MPAKKFGISVLSLLPLLLVSEPAPAAPPARQVVPVDTQPLTVPGDLASQMVDGIDRFLLQQTQAAAGQRQQFWNRDFSSVAAYQESVQPNRQRLAQMLGIKDQRVAPVTMEPLQPVGVTAVSVDRDTYRIVPVRWPVLLDPAPATTILVSVHGTGLLLVPDRDPVADVVAIPDADQTPEQLCGLAPGLPPEHQSARLLAEAGCRVLVPTLISRDRRARNGRADLTNREYIYRSAFELGRHLIGYELQKVFAAVDWFEQAAPDTGRRVAVVGNGEGGLLALYAGALDPRIDVVRTAGYFGSQQPVWQQPVDRNVFGLRREFSDADVASLVLPRTIRIAADQYPELELEGNGGAPGGLTVPSPEEIAAEVDRLTDISQKLPPGTADFVVFEPRSAEPAEWIRSLLDSLAGGDGTLSQQRLGKQQSGDTAELAGDAAILQAAAARRQQQQLEELDRHNQLLLRESPFVRDEFMSRLDTSSLDAYRNSVEQYRQIFREDVIGEFDQPLLPFNARARKSWEHENWTGYEVVLDVFPDVFAYGVLLVPNDLQPGQRRPVVVCQHGLEGRPTDTFLDDHRAYHDFAARLCEQGFITFAAQNPYIFQDRFRTLQRKANPLGKTLFSVIVPQHQQIVNWLKAQPFVDPERIGFYGLSYGGKSAMRIPALVTDYCLSICSADFNEWVLKNASTRHNFSYVWTGEYEIFEWDLGSTFNYAEMAALICPRPFMVERGHFDGVGTDEWVAFEYAKVRNLYAAKLGIPERTEIEWFVGPHTINGQGTFEFLQRHLNWPQPSEKPSSE